MNLFMPYKSIMKSLMCLDDKRLNKQILECKTICNVIDGAKGYANHPVIKYYAQYPKFVYTYAKLACIEYCIRFKKQHSLMLFFDSINIPETESNPNIFYCEGSIGSENAIRCYDTDKSLELFKQKLCDKWDNDTINKRPAKWTNRDIPEFYIEHLEVAKCQN